MFGAIFDLVTRVSDYRYLEKKEKKKKKLKNCSLQINSLASNNCFNDKNVSQNGINALSKMVLKTVSPLSFLVTKLKISSCLDHTFLFIFHQHVIQIFPKEYIERLKTSNVSIINSNTEEF